MIEMKDHVAVVTGGASGIGEAVCLRLAKDGIPIVIQDLNEAAAGALATSIVDGGGRAEAIGGDVANEADVAAMFERCTAAFGACTLLHANAGHAELSPFAEITTEAFDRMVAVHLRGVYLCDRAALGPMLERGAGVIVNTASQLGQRGAPELAHYAAAKAGIIGLTKSIALEVSGRGVRVNAVAPGPIETPILGMLTEEDRRERAAALPLGRMGQAWEVAETVAFLASPAAATFVGQTLGPNSGDVML